MNFGIGKSYSVFLMSLRKNAPYADAIDEATGTLIYEGHDQPKTKDISDPKTVDQPLQTPKGGWTENGKFFRAAMDFKSGLRKKPELIKVYEKIADGIGVTKVFLNYWMQNLFRVAVEKSSNFTSSLSNGKFLVELKNSHTRV